LRCSCFGPTLQCWTACGECGEKIELNIAADAIAPMSKRSNDRALGQHVTINGETFRLPTSRDLARVARDMARDPDPAAAAAHLLRLCRVGADSGQKNWSEQELEMIGERMAEADPLAEILLGFNCPVCSSTCSEPIDLPTFFWAEMEALARKLIQDVHVLACAYGWSEREILSLGDARRRLYLEMVQG
jgi:hypothetical protein